MALWPGGLRAGLRQFGLRCAQHSLMAGLKPRPAKTGRGERKVEVHIREAGTGK
jgi:hypothetical protein